jgi:hypothetical protein
VIGCCLIILIGLTAQSSEAQSPTDNQQSAETSSTLTLTPAEQRAISVVDHLLEISKSFPDEYLRVRFQAEIADTLWAYDGARARRILTDAFRAIDSVREPADKGVPPIYLGADTSLPLRRDLLRIAARGDSALAHQLAESVISDSTVSVANSPDRMAGMPNEKESLYLAVASQIVPVDQSRAMEMARTALSNGTGNNEILAGFIRLAQSLQLRDSKAANDLFAFAIAETQRHPDHAFGSIRFLGLYCFPESGGMVRFRTTSPGGAPGAAVGASPAAISRFLTFAYDTVMRQPETESPRPNWSAPGGLPRWVGNDYYAIQSLAPYFDKHLPEKATPFRAKMEALIKRLPAGAGNPGDVSPPDPNNVDAQVAAAEKARFPAERNSFYDRAVELALMNNDHDRALTLANKIGDSSQRSAAVMRVMRAAVSLSIQKKDFDGAYNYSKQMTDSERLGVLRSLALAVAPNEKARAEELLAEAFQLAESLEDNSLKASQLMSTADIASRVDIESGFRAMRLAVDQINRTGYNPMEEDPARPGASGHSTTMHRLGYQGIMITFNNVFKLLGLADFTHAMQLAQTVESRELSAMAQLSVCRAVLSRPFVTHVAGNSARRQRTAGSLRLQVQVYRADSLFPAHPLIP